MLSCVNNSLVKKRALARCRKIGEAYKNHRLLGVSSQTIKRLEDCSMTTQEKQMIASLSEKGLGYRKIAAQIGISENTVKSYLKRMTAADDQKEPDQPAAVFSCPQCGMEIYQQPGRKAKRFCSEPIPLPARFLPQCAPHGMSAQYGTLTSVGYDGVVG